MTIVRGVGIGYAAGTVLCLAVVAWLGYHEFVEEPAQYAARGMPNDRTLQTAPGEMRVLGAG